MTNPILLILLAFSVYSCNSTSNQITSQKNDSLSITNLGLNNEISFTYQIDKNDWDKEVIKVDCWLHNNSNRDIYFLSESCDGTGDFVKIDTNLYSCIRRIHCNISFPIKVLIPLKDSIEFPLYLIPKANFSSMNFSFFFKEVASDYKPESLSLWDSHQKVFSGQLIKGTFVP